MANFGQFGKAQGEALDFSFKFKGDELEKDPTSKYREIPEGEYPFTVKNYKFDTSQNGNDYVKVTMAVEYEGDEVYVSDTLTLTEKNLWKFATFFSAIGMWDEVKDVGVTESTWDKVIGKEGRFMNGHRVYNGKTQNQVKAYVKDLKPAVQ